MDSTNKNIKEENNNIIVEQNIINQVNEEEKETIEDNIVIEEVLPQEPETYTVKYATVGLNIRQEPSMDGVIVDTVNINTELDTVDNSEENGWIKIKIDDNYYYVASRFLSDEKVEIKVEEPKPKVNNYISNNNTGVLTKSKGVNYFNGHRETWYSQRVLPGGGLRIPGRHVDERGLVCDENGYICVASSDYSWGTIVETSLGTGRVYDSGCASGTIDIYCDW
jgi:hypothetical protein